MRGPTLGANGAHRPDRRPGAPLARRLRVEVLEERRLLAPVPELVYDDFEGEVVLDDLAAVGENLLFFATTGELWKSNGTQSGTYLVKDFGWCFADPDIDCDRDRQLTASNGKVYFTVGNFDGSYEALVRSDGTDSGTRVIWDFRGRDIDVERRVSELTDVEGALYFSDGELWRANETGQAVLVKDILPYNYFEYYIGGGRSIPIDSSPREFAPVNGVVFFSADSQADVFNSRFAFDRELWRTDGTGDGTVRVQDIVPGDLGSYPFSLTPYADHLLFFAANEEASFDLWATDGTTDGTIVVSDLPPNSWGHLPQDLAVVGTRLFFSTVSAESGRELWVTDGTAAGTVMVRDIASGSNGSDPMRLVALGDALVFSANDGVTGQELWLSDGTEGGTWRVADIRAGTSGSYPYALTAIGNQLFFSADDGVHGRELWVSDGTVAGTYLVADIADGSNGSFPRSLIAVDNTLYFFADHRHFPSGLWKVVVEENDTAPPTVAATFSAGVPVTAGQQLRHLVTDLTIAVSEPLAAGITEPASWALARDGVDANTQISGITFGLNAVTNRHEAIISFAPALTGGSYTLTLRDTVTDLSDNALDGDGDGQPGGDYSISFSVLAPLPAGDEFRVNTFTAGDQRGFPTSPGQLAMAADGSFVVTWSNVDLDGSGDEIFYQRYSASGTSQGGASQANVTVAGRQRNSTVASAADGSFVITWNSDHVSANNYDIYARRFAANGTPLGDEFLVNTLATAGIQRSPIVSSAPDGRFAVVWFGPDASQNGTYARLYSAEGAPLGNEFPVNLTTTGQQQIEAAALDDAGRLIVVWQSDGQDGDQGGIYARVFDPLGHPLTNELAVNQTTTGQQEFPTVAVDQLGNFLVTWTSDGQDGDVGGIYARRFDENGMPLSDEFRVSETAAGAQRYSSVAIDNDGDAIISWSSQAQDGDGYGIYARRYNAAGQPEGHEFRVNTYTTSDQLYSSVALDDDGDFVVVWSSQGQDGSGYGVYGQRYATPRPVQSGDTNGDGEVGIDDLNNVRNHFGETGDGVLGDTAPFDGKVDIQDLNAVRNYFGAAGGGSASRTGPSYRATTPPNGAQERVESQRVIRTATPSQSGGRQLAPEAADVVFGMFANNASPTVTQKPLARRPAFH